MTIMTRPGLRDVTNAANANINNIGHHNVSLKRTRVQAQANANNNTAITNSTVTATVSGSQQLNSQQNQNQSSIQQSQNGIQNKSLNSNVTQTVTQSQGQPATQGPSQSQTGQTGQQQSLSQNQILQNIADNHNNNNNILQNQTSNSDSQTLKMVGGGGHVPGSMVTKTSLTNQNQINQNHNGGPKTNSNNFNAMTGITNTNNTNNSQTQSTVPIITYNQALTTAQKESLNANPQAREMNASALGVRLATDAERAIQRRNPQEASEYIDPIHQYLKRAENNLDLRVSNPDYLNDQPEISARMRGILLDWLVEVHYKFKLAPDTLYLTVNLIDRYLHKDSLPPPQNNNSVTKTGPNGSGSEMIGGSSGSTSGAAVTGNSGNNNSNSDSNSTSNTNNGPPIVRGTSRKKLQLVGGTCLLIASKYEEFRPPEVGDICYIMDNAYSRDDILDMEVKILNTLKFQVTVPSSLQFLEFLISGKGMGISRDEDHFFLSQYLVESTMLDTRFLKYKPSELAAASLYLANRIRKLPAPWPTVLRELSGYDETTLIKPLAKQIFELIPSYRNKSLYKKYSMEKYRNVAPSIPPQ